VTAPHDAPSAAELVVAVREWIRSAVIDGDGEPNRFHARVAANMLAIVGRELELGPGQAISHEKRLAALGLTDDAALAAAIRSGSLDDRADEVRAAVWASVRDKLAVANPKYLDRLEP
jgi:Domain of unknown function (DUF6285)